jgi:hypothetical protein
MKLSVLAIFITLWGSVLAAAWGDDHYGDNDDDQHHCHHRRSNGDDDHHRSCTHQTGKATPVDGVTLHGTPYSPSPRANEPDDDEPGPVTPNPSGPIVPSSPAINLNLMGTGNNGTNPPIPRTKRQSCGGSGIVFDTSTVFDSDTDVGVNGSPAEPSGAKSGNVIFSTSNWIAAISIDGGATFNVINPTVYAGPANHATDGGFCCDQVVQYLPSIDRFVWLLQYTNTNNSNPALNVNRLRLITFHPSDVDTKGINSWIYMDILSSNGWLDYGELGVGTTQLYLSNTLYGPTSGLVVFRIPIDALNVVGSLTYWQTHASDGTVAQGSRLSQNPGDTVFWAGHSNPGTTIRVFKWTESSTSYSWNDLNIDPWPSNTSNFVSTCPGDRKTNWLFVNSANNIIGSTRRSTNEVWFGWNANSGGRFPNPHAQVVQINVAKWPSLSVIKQWQIWNPNFAFAFPYFYTSSECDDVGLAVVFGGGSSNPSSALGVITSDGVLTQTVYYPELSDTCDFRFGDYLTVRSENAVSYEGFVYAQQSTDSGVERNPRYVEFGRG